MRDLIQAWTNAIFRNNNAANLCHALKRMIQRVVVEQTVRENGLVAASIAADTTLDPARPSNAANVVLQSVLRPCDSSALATLKDRLFNHLPEHAPRGLWDRFMFHCNLRPYAASLNRNDNGGDGDKDNEKQDRKKRKMSHNNDGTELGAAVEDRKQLPVDP